MIRNKSKSIKNEIVKYAKILDSKGLVNSVEGNLSIIDRETGELYITPSGTRKLFLNEDSIAVLHGDKQIGGNLKRSSEYLLHVAALNARPDCNAAAHIHAPYLTAFAYCAKDIEIKCSTTFALLFGNKIQCLPYGEPGTVHIADGIDEVLKNNDLVLLANHGVIAVGKTLEDAVKIIEAAEEVLKIYMIANGIGTLSNITSRQYESLNNNHLASIKNRFKT